MENKYQHYVPQFYLRNFSNNGRSIGSYIYHKRKLVENASIRNVCGRDFLYGEDLEIEKWFQKLEGIWCGIISRIITTGKMELDEEAIIYLKMFFYLSDVRTAYTADAITDENNLLVKACARMYREHERIEIGEDEIEKLQIKVDKPNLVYIQNMRRLPEVMDDLSIVLLHNTTNRQFVTSDCPVVRYNQLFIARDYFRPYGYGHIGFQCFLPISPEFCLVLYDSVVYECKNLRESVIRINAPDQIIELNKLFVENSRQALYFNNKEREWIIRRMVEKKNDTSQKFANGVLGNEKQGYLLFHSLDCVKKRIKLPQFVINPDFLRIPFPYHAAGPMRPKAEEIRKK